MGSQLVQDDIASFSRSNGKFVSSKDGSTLHEKLADWLTLNRNILSNAQSAVDVLTDLLNYDKIETGKLQMEVHDVKDDLVCYSFSLAGPLLTSCLTVVV